MSSEIGFEKIIEGIPDVMLKIACSIFLLSGLFATQKNTNFNLLILINLDPALNWFLPYNILVIHHVHTQWMLTKLFLQRYHQ